MGTPAVDALLTCDECRQPVPADSTSWLRLELETTDIWHEADFCTQEHAAAWLERPLPPPTEAGHAPPATWLDRVLGGLAITFVIQSLVMFVLGWVVFLRWIWS